MKADPIGIYVHIPFCLKKCSYCDFCSYPSVSDQLREAYLSRLVAEISVYKERSLTVDTVFFGGGTPTLLTSKEFSLISDALHKNFKIKDNAEFTIEANPKTVTLESMRAFAECGVNRVSIGLQSIHENELKILGRIHNFRDFLRSYDAVRAAGIGNVNVDVMYGIPDQSVESFAESLEAVTKLSPEHLSLYSLIIEEGTPIHGLQNSLSFPSEDDELSMYFGAVGSLLRQGYEHYEISNYSKAGYRCRHNEKYWNGKEYLGFGVAAYSYLDGVRFGNVREIGKYVTSSEPSAYKELIDREAEAFEFIMLHLRISDGFSLSEYLSRFGCMPSVVGSKRFYDLCSGGYVNFDGDRISLTDKGMYVSNTIIAEFT